MDLSEGEPERPEGPGEHGIPARMKNLGSRKGDRFFHGINPLKRRYKAGRPRRKAQERKE
jgi:hypothetical protein